MKNILIILATLTLLTLVCLHYELEKLDPVKEDVVKEILGTEALKDIIQNFDDSDKIIYQLGADEDMALEVVDAMDAQNHVLAVRLLERASGGLKPKPKTNKTTPDPDTEIEGGSPGKSKHTNRGPEGAKYR